MNHLCRSHSVLSATDRLFHPPLTASDAPSVPTDFPVDEGASPDVGTSPLPQLPTRGTGPIPLPLLFFSPSSFFHPIRLRRDLSCPFQCPRSSASVQPVLCVNCSICRCIPDASVKRDKLHILLFLRHFEKPSNSHL